MKCALLGLTLAILLAGAFPASSQTWTPLNHQPGVNLGAMLQMRDGRILAHEEQSGNPRNWWILTPDATGSYINGTWSSGGQLPAGYAPFYFSSQVFLDGRTVLIEGGEYNNGTAVWTTLGASCTYTPGGSCTWVNNAPPAGWGTIGDAQSVLLADGRYLQANCCTKQTALYAGPSSWTPSGNVKAIRNDESGWTLLPTGKVLAVDVQINNECGGSLKSSEFYTPGTGIWSCGPQLIDQLWVQNDQELGAAVLMYNGEVIQFGGNVSKTNILNSTYTAWRAGPSPIGGLDQADGPAALEPNGKVLAMLSPGLFQSGCQMVEYNPSTGTLSNTVNPQNCPSDSSFVGHLMMLPTGQIMFTDFSGRVEVYTPAPGVVSGVAPTVVFSSTTVHSGATNRLYGTQLNGLAQNNAYGDDYQGDTNYPLVRLRFTNSGAVVYAFTHDDCTHSIAPGTVSCTQYDVPALTFLRPPDGTGVPADLEVVVNGIASRPVHIIVR